MFYNYEVLSSKAIVFVNKVLKALVSVHFFYSDGFYRMVIKYSHVIVIDEIVYVNEFIIISSCYCRYTTRFINYITFQRYQWLV